MTTGKPAGICRFCGCSDFDPCEDGCWWIDRGHRVCSCCADAEKAEGRMLRAMRTAGYRIDAPWLRAFHRGFLIGWFAVSARSRYGRNPYHKNVIAEAWRLGHQAGAEAGRIAELTFGPVTNRPGTARLAWLLDLGRRRDRRPRRRRPSIRRPSGPHARW